MSKECFNGDGLHPKKSSKKDFIEDKRKEFYNDFVYDNHIRDVWDATKIKDFLTSSLNEAWEKSKEEERHDNEILVNTILDTKNQELQQQKEEARQLAITNERERIWNDIELWLLRLHNEPEKWTVAEAIKSLQELQNK